MTVCNSTQQLIYLILSSLNNRYIDREFLRDLRNRFSMDNLFLNWDKFILIGINWSKIFDIDYLYLNSVFIMLLTYHIYTNI